MIDITLTSCFSDWNRRRSFARFDLYPSYEEHVNAGVQKAMIDEHHGKREGLSNKIMSIMIDMQLERHVGVKAISVGDNDSLAYRIQDIQSRNHTNNQKMDYFARACEDYPGEFFQSETDFLAYQAALVERKIETNCQPLVHCILNNGGTTLWSNGYGPGYKGVFWRGGDDGVVYFTSIANGETYKNVDLLLGEQHGIIDDFDTDLKDCDRVDLPFDVFDALPVECCLGLPAAAL